MLNETFSVIFKHRVYSILSFEIESEYPLVGKDVRDESGNWETNGQIVLANLCNFQRQRNRKLDSRVVEVLNLIEEQQHL